MDYKNLTAPCGRDCFNCPFYLAGKNKKTRQEMANRLNIPLNKVACSGCRNIAGDCEVLKHYGFNGQCKIYACIKDKKLDFCSDCTNFPCERLHPLADHADKFPHNLKVFNLCMIQKMGLENWAKTQAKKSFDRYYCDKLDSCL
ncbi:DUF3795 domain-containing protein [Marinilabiliaceae bacterium JC017]|nr:DUF3795 domain-containing protein [Marinilabiliaceae bacterium JC017]